MLNVELVVVQFTFCSIINFQCPIGTLLNFQIAVLAVGQFTNCSNRLLFSRLMFKQHLANRLYVEFVKCSVILCSICSWRIDFLVKSHCSKVGVQIVIVEVSWKALERPAAHHHRARFTSCPKMLIAVVLLALTQMKYSTIQ